MSAYGLIKDPEIFVADHVSIFRSTALGALVFVIGVVICIGDLYKQQVDFPPFFVNNGGLTNLGTWTLSAAVHQTVGGATFAAQTGGRGHQVGRCSRRG